MSLILPHPEALGEGRVSVSLAENGALPDVVPGVVGQIFTV
jgi:hypothetical protein